MSQKVSPTSSTAEIEKTLREHTKDCVQCAGKFVWCSYGAALQGHFRKALRREGW